MMLREQLSKMCIGECLYTWSGKLLDSAHKYVRADLVRLRAFYRHQGHFSFLEIPPYRPAAVHKGVTHGESLHRLVFSSQPLVVIKNGARKGRTATLQDLHLDESSTRIDISASLQLTRPLDSQDRSFSHSLEICECMFDSYEAAGGLVDVTADLEVPDFYLCTRKPTQSLFKRTDAQGREAAIDEDDSHIYFDADYWYGQGVWCAEPGHLGHWFMHTRTDKLKFCSPGIEVAVNFKE